MGGFPVLQAFLARHYIGKKARKENEQIEMFCKYLIIVCEKLNLSSTFCKLFRNLY